MDVELGAVAVAHDPISLQVSLRERTLLVGARVVEGNPRAVLEPGKGHDAIAAERERAHLAGRRAAFSKADRYPLAHELLFPVLAFGIMYPN